MRPTMPTASWPGARRRKRARTIRRLRPTARRGLPTRRVTRRFRRPRNCGWCGGSRRSLIERMLPFVTAFSNCASVNILDAAPQVVAALPGMTPETLAGGIVAAWRSAAGSTIAARDGRRGRRHAGGVQSLPDDGRHRFRQRAAQRRRGRDPASRRAATSPIVYCRGATTSDGGTAPQRAAYRDEVASSRSARSSAAGPTASPPR